MPAPTFEQLVKMEPRLGILLEEARGLKKDKGPVFCGNAAWYGYAGFPGLKPRLMKLVGWERPDLHPVLSHSPAYDVAYDAISAAVPPCRGNCVCSWEPPDDEE